MNPNIDPDKSHMQPEELELERKLRPLSFDDFAGQEKVLENLKVFVQASKNWNVRIPKCGNINCINAYLALRNVVFTKCHILS